MEKENADAAGGVTNREAGDRGATAAAAAQAPGGCWRLRFVPIVAIAARDVPQIARTADGAEAMRRHRETCEAVADLAASVAAIPVRGKGMIR